MAPPRSLNYDPLDLIEAHLVPPAIVELRRARGKYDTAVFEAMKAVEVTVREAAGLTAGDIGKDCCGKRLR